MSKQASVTLGRPHAGRTGAEDGTAPEPTPDCLRVDGLCKSYPRGHTEVSVLKGVSLRVARGEMVAVMGASGSGKTTLINLLGCLDRPDSGTYLLDGLDVVALSEARRALLRNRKIGFVFQNFNLLPRLSAVENVMMPMAYSGTRSSEAQCRARARTLLERVGLGDRLDHLPSELSGGEQQRVAIARALVNEPSVLIADEPTGNLDSKTGQEILSMFQRLNAEDGITMIVVTHDSWVAGHAGRTIRIRDGLTDARPVTDPADRQSHGAPPAAAPPPLLVERRSTRPRDLVRVAQTAVRAIQRNALRSALTTLGIIIGVASLITIAEIGKGSARAILAVMESTGANTVLVQAGAASSNGVSLGSGSIKTLTPDDAEAIANECSAVASLAPIVYARRQVVHGSKNWVPIYIYGTTPGLLKVRDWEQMAEGEAFNDEDVRNVAMVCLLGKTLVDELFGGESPVGKEVLVNDVPLRVVGVLTAKGTNIIGIDQDDILLAPWTTIKYRVSGGAMPTLNHATTGSTGPELANQLDTLARRFPRSPTGLYPSQSVAQLTDTPTLNRFSNVDSILVRATSQEEVPTALYQITELLRERHHIGPDMEDDFDVRDFTEVIKAVQRTVRLVAGLLICVALVSLAVGGVGIMNIMLVSVTERYREIGLRMAVGATATDILRQFLVEAVVLCVLGGVVGLMAGRTVSVLIRVLASWPTETSWLAVAGAVGVSVTVGIVFGYYPAWKASRLNPIEALRYE
jgi:macrolide transport system ATP-binding/permease protein